MGKPRMIGQFKPYTPNSRADMRKRKQYCRNQEYTDRHKEVLEESRAKQAALQNFQRKREAYYG